MRPVAPDWANNSLPVGSIECTWMPMMGTSCRFKSLLAGMGRRGGWVGKLPVAAGSCGFRAGVVVGDRSEVWTEVK
jgi:hypothetical protein